ncbi:MAG: glycosyltransferase [Verrucomicrobia bacterium]|nr:glycosyltransferase [Verrucomicrobiota bacterium]
MRILIVSDLETTGGAAIACQRLTQGFIDLGADCIRAVGTMDGGSPTQEKFLLSPGKRLEGIATLAASFHCERVAETLTNCGSRRQLRLRIQDLKPDIIHIHNLHKAKWNIGLVEECARHASVAWTLHDTWSMTGRCCYPYDCEKFISGCDAACPTPREYPALEPGRIAAAWTAKKRVLESHPNITAVCPSHWMASQARRGIWHQNRVEVISNGLDLALYHPVDPVAARTALGLLPHIPTILIVADYLKERRKGGGLLEKVLAAAKSRPLQIATLGHSPPEISLPNIQHTHFGYISSDRMKAILYSAADLLLHMAPVDNLPNTVAEALACGTPVVAYATGGVPEMVKTGQTGWLADRFEAESFAAALDQALDTTQGGNSLRQSCRQFAEVHFDLARQASHYIALFQALAHPS